MRDLVTEAITNAIRDIVSGMETKIRTALVKRHPSFHVLSDEQLVRAAKEFGYSIEHEIYTGRLGGKYTLRQGVTIIEVFEYQITMEEWDV